MNSRRTNTFKPRKITILHRIQKKIVRGVFLLRNTAPVIISLKRITLQCHYGAVIKKCWTRNYYRRGPNYTSASGTGARNNSLYIPNCAKVISRFIPLGSGMISRLRRQTRNLSWALNRPQTKWVAALAPRHHSPVVAHGNEMDPLFNILDWLQLCRRPIGGTSRRNGMTI